MNCGAWGWPTCRAGAPQRAHDPNQFADHGRSARRKAFATAATLDTHNRSKKHKEIVFEAAFALKASDLVAPAPAPAAVSEPEVEVEQDEDAAMAEAVALSVADPTPSSSASVVDEAAPLPAHFESSGDPKLDLLVAKRLAAAPPLPPTSCLFCTVTTASAVETAAHMRQAHSFVIPEEEFLVDLEGLLKRLGEEVGTWNVCVCCGKGYGGNVDLDVEGQTDAEMRKKASKGVEGVRSHMQSKVSLRSSETLAEMCSQDTVLTRHALRRTPVPLQAAVRHRVAAS